MTYSQMTEIIRSAATTQEQIFVSRWLLMPESVSICGFTSDNIDTNREVLKKLHATINQPMIKIREQAGISQKQLSDRFVIPIKTIQGWETRTNCPIYVKLMIMELLGLINLQKIFGVD